MPEVRTRPSHDDATEGMEFPRLDLCFPFLAAPHRFHPFLREREVSIVWNYNFDLQTAESTPPSPLSPHPVNISFLLVFKQANRFLRYRISGPHYIRNRNQFNRVDTVTPDTDSLK